LIKQNLFQSILFGFYLSSASDHMFAYDALAKTKKIFLLYDLIAGSFMVEQISQLLPAGPTIALGRSSF
jgi:hypothetical protein